MAHAENLRTLAKQGHMKEAMQLLYAMNQSDSYTYASLLEACARAKSMALGTQVHQHMKKSGLQPDVILQTKLVSMYLKCRNLDFARQVFDEMAERNVVSWTAMIAGYAQQGQEEKALELFSQMQQAGTKADGITLSNVLRACAGAEALEQERCRFVEWDYCRICKMWKNGGCA